MKRKVAFILAVLIVLPAAARGTELGIIGGPVSKPQAFVYGFSVSSSLLVSILKIEFEGFRLVNEKGNFLTAGVKLKPKFGKFAPYGAIGGGMTFPRLNFEFDAYDFYTYFGVGSYFYIASMLSLRLDLRWLNFSDNTRMRFSVGLFLEV